MPLVRPHGRDVETHEVAKGRARRASLLAAKAHERAAEVHDQAAIMHDQLADGDRGDAADHRVRAAEHRKAAEDDRRHASEDLGVQGAGVWTRLTSGRGVGTSHTIGSVTAGVRPCSTFASARTVWSQSGPKGDDHHGGVHWSLLPVVARSYPVPPRRTPQSPRVGSLLVGCAEPSA